MSAFEGRTDIPLLPGPDLDVVSQVDPPDTSQVISDEEDTITTH
jgi:hypothetical protein